MELALVSLHAAVSKNGANLNRFIIGGDCSKHFM